MLIFATGTATGYVLSDAIMGDDGATDSINGNVSYDNVVGWQSGTVVTFDENDDGTVRIAGSQSCVCHGNVAVTDGLSGGKSYGVTVDGDTYEAVPSYVSGRQVVLFVDASAPINIAID